MPIRSLSSATNTISAKTARPSRVAACNLRAKPCATIPMPTAKTPPHATAGQAVAEATRHAGAKSRSIPSSRHTQTIATAVAAVTDPASHHGQAGKAPAEGLGSVSASPGMRPNSRRHVCPRQRGREGNPRSTNVATSKPSHHTANATKSVPPSSTQVDNCDARSAAKTVSANAPRTRQSRASLPSILQNRPTHAPNATIPNAVKPSARNQPVSAASCASKALNATATQSNAAPR